MLLRPGQTVLRLKKGITSQTLRFKHQPRNLLLLGERGGLVSSSFPPDKTAKFAQFMEDNTRVVYAGFDPTSDSLHIGNLLVVMGLLQAQRSGHQPIALIGGATAKIGDPSGKDSERPKLSDEAIEKNIIGIKDNLDRIFHHHEKHFWNKEGYSKLKPLIILNNQTWYQNVNLVHFLRDYGRHFRMGKMLAKESVERRIASENGLSFTEFSYQIFQAFDWLHLYREFDCSIQIGGTDQLGNIVSGHDLIQRVVGLKSPDIYGILLPLMTSNSGDKFGKSGSSPVWLSQTRMSPFEFYQFFMRLPDSKVEEILNFFTFSSLSEIKELISSHKKSPDKRKAQKRIAESLTLLVHGQEGLELAKKATSILFNDDNALTTLSSTTHEELNIIFNQAPYTRLLFSDGITVLQLAMKIGCFRTENDAIRIIDAGGFYINQHRHTNTDEVIVSHIHILPNKLTLVRVGKKNFYVVEWTNS